ncbi:hypothetical protein COBT_004166 [Conglomerata obtusa]
MANNTIITSGGSCILNIEIENEIFPCKALIITDATQELLIGTNWLAKFRTNIDLATNTLTIEGRNNLLRLSITCTKIIPKIQEMQYESRCFNTYNTKECILEPRETKLITILFYQME